MLKITYACPGAPFNEAPVTRKPSGGAISAEDNWEPGEDVFVSATLNVVELAAATDAGEMLAV